MRAGSNAEPLEFPDVANWNAEWHNTLENSAAFSYRVEYTLKRITNQFRDIVSTEKICSPVSTAALFTVAKPWWLPR